MRDGEDLRDGEDGSSSLGQRVADGHGSGRPRRVATLADIRRLRATFIILGLAVAGAGCGAAAPTSSTGAAQRNASKRARRAHRTAGPARLRYRSLFTLPAPLRDPASAALGGGRFVLIGGLNAADSSSSEVDVANTHGVISSSTLALAQHDAQGAALGSRVYVFGGGSLSELDHILSFNPAAGAVTTVGTLPVAQSDVAVTESGGTAYIAGGYDGTSFLNTVLAYRPGSRPRVIAHLPVGLRYASAVAAGGGILVIGGSTPTGVSNAIYRVDPQTGRVREIGRLPHGITHGGAGVLGSYAYLVGGRWDSTTAQTSAIWSINPSTGAVRSAGRLPQPTSDAGVLTVGNAILVVGGYTSSGSTLAGVADLMPSGSP